MIDDMNYHIIAWHRILNDLGANISLAQMKEACYGKNEELLERTFPGRFSAEEKKVISIEKEVAYQKDYAPELSLIKGLNEFLQSAKESKIKMAIGSAAIMFNIDFVLDGLNIRHYFNSVVSADQVSFSKPHPETYIKCSDRLSENPGNCIVFEDSLKGVEAAANAGMRAVVMTTLHEAAEFCEYSNVIFFAADYTDPRLSVLMGMSVYNPTPAKLP